MPTRCSITGCRSNRTKSDKITSVFSFPRDPLRQNQWEWAIQQLHDSNYTFKEGDKICMRHFEDELVEKEHRAVRDDGSVLTIPRKNFSLTLSAVPTLFDFLPDPSPRDRSRQIIPDFESLRTEFDDYMKDSFPDWKIAYNSDLPALSIYKIYIADDHSLTVKSWISLSEDLTIKRMSHPTVTIPELISILGRNLCCDEWGKLRKLFKMLNCDHPPPKKRKRRKNCVKDKMLVLEVSYDGQIEIQKDPGSDSSL